MKLRLPSCIGRRLGQFARQEDGQIVIEFVMVVPILFACFLMAVELGIFSMREMFLDRGLDMAVRTLRIDPTANHTHASVKDDICRFSGFLEDCDSTLNLEMAPMNPRALSLFNQSADCVDVSQPVQPQRQFVTPTDQNTLMLLRACYKYKPVFPTTGLGKALDKDGSGRAKMVSTAAFVTEPN